MMDLNGKTLILSSTSPRREKILSDMDIIFSVEPKTRFLEKYDQSTPHEQIPVLMAEGKSEGFHRELERNEILLTADTMVFVDDKAIGKPHHHEEAYEMLRSLSGKKHKVITAVTLRDRKGKVTFTDTSFVYFNDLSDEEIKYYVDKYKPFDKAGAYGIQEWIGYIGISRIEGSFTNIMGLPAAKTYQELKKFVNR
jgi:septum formation protein